MQTVDRTGCARVQHYLEQTLESGAIGSPPSWLVEHGAERELWRGAIALLAAALIAKPPTPFLVDCAACREGLAAYVETELDEGAAAALAADPAVGWHLWTCPECAEIYRLTRALAEEARAGILAP